MNIKEYKELKKTIDYHMDRYYNQDSPEISDYEYDQLMLQLKAAEKEHPEWITRDSPTQKIGGTAKRKAGVKVTHNVPMLSIEDVFDKNDVVKWVNKVHKVHPDCSFSVEAKIDGLSMTLRYSKIPGKDEMKLTLGETRGDGYVGEDVTANAWVIPDIQQQIKLPYDYLELRGEVYMSREDFKRFNEEQEKIGKNIAANPRNLAAGTLRQLDSTIVKERGLKMFVFNVQDGPRELVENHIKGLEILAGKGIPIVYHKLCKTKEDVLEAIDEIGRMRSKLPYDIDGAVVKINESAYRSDFQTASKYAPGHIAFKYPPEEKATKLLNIELNVGRTGVITPIAVFEPITLAGTTVSRAVLHNQDFIDEKGVSVGDTILVRKAGEIIPEVVSVVSHNDNAPTFKIPDICPSCGSKTYREEDEAAIRCSNPKCPAQLIRNIIHFASRDAMDIDGLGPAVVHQLVEANLIHSSADLYSLTLDDILSIDRKAEKSAEKLINAIEKSKRNDLSRLVFGLGIRNIGQKAAEQLSVHFKDLNTLMNASVEEITAIDGIGEIMAKNVVEFFSHDESKQIISTLTKSGVNTVSLNAPTSDKFKGLTFVLTGTLPTLSRSEASEIIKKMGGSVSSSVSKKTHYVVAGEEAGSKLEKALQLGIPVIDENELIKMAK